ncbi:MAG: RelA/SpoT family protein [Bacteroidales bacterium]
MGSTEVDLEREECRHIFEDMLSSSLLSFTKDESVIMHKAFNLAYEAHKGTRRKSGELYITHPIAVAKIVSHEIGLGYKAISAALLHDVIEDTDYTSEDIEGLFGEKIAFLVTGLTKLDSVFDKNVSLQAENFRKLLLAMADDIRVVLIKLADRLHNMRTLGSMAPHKQEKIASETIYLYAPLAHRLGLYNIKTELEDLTMKFQFPKVYQELQAALSNSASERENYINEFIAPIQQKLVEQGFSFEITGRIKSIYSIWTKMQAKQVSFNEIYDLFAVRIVFNPQVGVHEKLQCWQIYSLITDIYKPNHERLRDWISTPKSNGYEALHTTVMGPAGRWVELQIRSGRMNEIAERGYAAHWLYKERPSAVANNEKGLDTALDSWLARIREMLANNEQSATDFLDQFRLNLFASEITVYTPKGKVISLPNKATALDFAYEIHTEVGNKAIGAKVNHKLVALNHVLSSGDQVEVLTADNKKPEVACLQFVMTSRARNHITTAIKTETKRHFQKGKQAVEDTLKNLGLTPNAMLYKRITNAYRVNNKEELFSKIGAGILSSEKLEKAVKKQRRNKFLRYMELQLFGTRKRNTRSGTQFTPIDKRAFLLKEDTDPSTLTYRVAKCCQPIPGDNVIGFLQANNKVVIHKKHCSNALNEASHHGNKLVNTKWTEHKTLYFLARIKVSGIDRFGLLLDLVKVVSEDMHINVRTLNAQSENGLFEDNLDVYVHSTKDLQTLMAKLQKINGIEKVERVETVD